MTASGQSVRLLAIDPSLRSTGYGVIEQVGGRLRALDFGTLASPPSLPQSACLLRIERAIGELVGKFSPDVCAIEGVIYVQSHRTAITLGAARAAAIIPVARAGLAIHEYAPRRVKQALVGRGAAD